MDLSKSVIIPREDFIELQEAAWLQTPTPIGDRIATTVQTAMFCTILVASVTAGSWAWAAALDWKETRKFNREMQQLENHKTKS